MSIETERLLLRPYSLDDAESMFKNWASDPEVTKFLTWDPHENIEVTKQLIAMWVEEDKKGTAHRFVIVPKDLGEPIGAIDVVGYLNGQPVVGYCLSRKYWNRGYMTEAFTAFIKYLFNHGYKKIHIAAHVDNIGSNRVIQKCGFTFTHQEARDIFKGEPALINWYELLK